MSLCRASYLAAGDVAYLSGRFWRVIAVDTTDPARVRVHVARHGHGPAQAGWLSVPAAEDVIVRSAA